MYRNTANRNVTKYVKAMQVYCDRGDLVKANRELENVYQALDDLMETTKARIALSEDRKAKKDVRPETQRPKVNKGSDSPSKEGKAKARPISSKVQSKQSKPKS